MNIRFISCAEQEFSEAIDYYNKQLPGLGYEFAVEIKNTLARISSFPNAWPIFSKRSRRCISNRFPYGVLYQIRQDEILITAIQHLKCDPLKWQERVAKT
ncbi:MAG: type II toxin-antitoxin system RelE/ParE family toxin [Nitrospirota bacterium]